MVKLGTCASRSPVLQFPIPPEIIIMGGGGLRNEASGSLNLSAVSLPSSRSPVEYTDGGDLLSFFYLALAKGYVWNTLSGNPLRRVANLLGDFSLFSVICGVSGVEQVSCLSCLFLCCGLSGYGRLSSEMFLFGKKMIMRRSASLIRGAQSRSLTRHLL
jgi:hypothetical protein